MKRIEIYMWGAFLVIVFTLINTKPSDEYCIKMTRQAMIANQGGGVLHTLEGTLAINNYTVAVENTLFYKKVYSNTDGHILAIGILGQVILQ